MNAITPVDALRKAVDLVGGQSALAEKLTTARPGEPVSQARVWNWINRDKRAPSDCCPDIEGLTGIACELLRPDVNWEVLRRKAKKATPAAAVSTPAEQAA